MNFSDEDYRRLYIRRTVTNRRLGWEGRAVMHEMLYEFDRAGVFEFGDDAAQDIADLVDLPLEVVQAGLSRLLATKTWVMTAGRIVWTRFVEGQSCPRSDRLRQQELRERRRDDALRAPVESPIAKTAELTSAVTPRAPLSRESRTVTPSRAEPNQTEPPISDARETGVTLSPAPDALPMATPAPVVREPTRKLSRFCPADFEPNDKHRMRCAELKIELSELLREFKRHEFQRDYSDWDRRFDGWIEKAKLLRDAARASPASGTHARASPPPESVRVTGWGQCLDARIVELAKKLGKNASAEAGAFLRSGALDLVTSHAEADRLFVKHLRTSAKKVRTEAA